MNLTPQLQCGFPKTHSGKELPVVMVSKAPIRTQRRKKLNGLGKDVELTQSGKEK